MIAALLLAAAVPSEIAWTAEGAVHDGARDLPIRMRGRLTADGGAISDSWPIAEGEAAGLRRMVITASGGWIERNGQRSPMPPAMFAEERTQFAFYGDYQRADRWCSAVRNGARAFGATLFRCRKGELTDAANRIGAIRQDFRLFGTIRSGGAALPLAMELRRDGKRYFTMRVERLRAR